jgi:hypothetical protein
MSAPGIVYYAARIGSPAFIQMNRPARISRPDGPNSVISVRAAPPALHVHLIFAGTNHDDRNAICSG